MTQDARRLLTVDDYHQTARETLPKMAYDYFSSGADDQRTLARNRSAFDDYEIWYRVLVDVSAVDTSTKVLGTTVSSPILVAPTAFHKLAHSVGEPETARGASEGGTVFTMSTLATTSIEEVSAASQGPKWFQLYVHKDRGLTKSLIERAESAGFLALVVTVDAPVLGRRLADERNQFALPEGVEMVNLGDASEDTSTSHDGSTLGPHVAGRHDASFNWSDLDWIRSVSGLPILLKGIIRADDARNAVAAGVEGIVVSNHGGRQMDRAPASIDALSSVVDVAGGECVVLMDGGVRSGSDVFIALALGAKAVLIGRPAIWGLAVGGAEGVTAVLGLLRDELVRTMTLAGCADVTAITADLVRRS